ncbi:MAG: S-adenosylmethionine:tRNA ribosyltransferase-isomerase, partial [Oscillospiraceae bacterium]
MKTADFFYDLPQELIAQTPTEKRDMSRLMVLKENGDFEHKHFCDIIEYLHKGDALVLNNSK